MAELHQSAMGKKFYEKDIPAILGQLKRIADALEKENKQLKESLNSILGILKKTLEGVSNEHRNV